MTEALEGAVAAAEAVLVVVGVEVEEEVVAEDFSAVDQMMLV